MASTFEKSVKGGTKIKLAAPKSKYVEHILVATHAGEAGVAEIFRALTNRLRDSTWTIVFKSLIIVHLMIREGEPDVTLKYLSQSPGRKLAINHFTEVQTQGHNIKTYSDYLLARAKEYGTTRVDYVRNGEGRLKKLNVEKGLLRETESVQTQLKYLLRCQPLGDGEPENEITLTAFRLLTMDLLVLFHVMNEGTINVLEHYFEFSKPDARRALNIYQTFCKQTEAVVSYLQVARLHEHSTRLEIPKIKHAPLSLAASLEEYLNDKDFEINRRQYLAEKEAKRNGGKTTNGASKPSAEPPTTTRPNTASQPPAATAPPQPPPSMPLIDLFDSIEENQQTLGQPAPQFVQQPSFQQPGFQTQPQQMDMGGFGQQPPQQALSPQYGQGSNPFAQMQAPQAQPQIQTQFPSTGMGGFAPQTFSHQGMPQGAIPGFPQQQPMPSQPMPGVPSIAEPLQPQQTSTNPFRQSMMPAIGGSAALGMLGSPTGASGLSRSPTNPFAKHNTGFQAQTQSPTGMSSSPFSSLPAIQEPQAGSPFAPQQPQPLQPQPTSTNPFARNPSPQQGSAPGGGLTVHATGSTNPFRQSAFVNQQTGQGWQNAGQGTLGGMDLNQVPTTSVFPRPGQQTGQFMG